ncbi:Zinc finger, PHD-type [Sesbania bispinosa]|nr:Zinc finger, PHD-type [Sesbania bispinosa]
MVRGGKFSGKSNFRKKGRSKEGSSDDSDEDYVVSDEGRDVSDYYCSSLDGCASEESFDSFIEDEEFQGVRNSNRSKAKIRIRGGRKKNAKDDEFPEDDEFTAEEEDYSDDEEEMSGRQKKNNGMKMGKKVLKKKASVVSTKGGKRRSSRASKKPMRTKPRKNGRLRRKVKCDNEGDFIDNGPAIRTSRKKQARKRRRMILSDSDCVSLGSTDFEYTISEEEREQVREAKKLCGSLRNNLRSSSLQINNEEAGVQEDLHLQQKPPGRKGKEKIEEPQGRKGKEKVENLKSEVGKQWAKVESRCPLCKQRFKTISKPARSTMGIDLREVVIQVPERDQVYQPSEEELRSYIDPYEYVICSECHLGGDDGLMLLCDICDSPAHTYCVGLGREVPEGNWYCDGCRPVALGSSSSQVQEAEPRVTIQSLPARPSPLLHVRETIDLNLISSPLAVSNQGFVHLSSSRFIGRSVDGASPVSGGAPTLSERRWIQRQIHQLRSVDRMTTTTGRTNSISAISSTSNLYSSQIDQCRETAPQNTRTQDVGTSYHTFFEERLYSNISPLMQNGTSWPGHVGTPSVPDCEQVHQFSRSNMVTDGSSSPAVIEDFHIVKEQVHSMVKSHLKSLSQNIDLGHSTLKDIARSSMHTILAACGLEHMKNEVRTVPPPSVCPHIELTAGDVVKRILDTRMPSQWLRLGL